MSEPRYPLHDPRDRRLPAIMFFLCIGMLAFVFWFRDEVDSGTLFGITCVLGGCAGIMSMGWLGDRR